MSLMWGSNLSLGLLILSAQLLSRFATFPTFLVPEVQRFRSSIILNEYPDAANLFILKDFSHGND